jgi:hypothetical protein
MSELLTACGQGTHLGDRRRADGRATEAAIRLQQLFSMIYQLQRTSGVSLRVHISARPRGIQFSPNQLAIHCEGGCVNYEKGALEKASAIHCSDGSDYAEWQGAQGYLPCRYRTADPVLYLHGRRHAGANRVFGKTVSSPYIARLGSYARLRKARMSSVDKNCLVLLACLPRTLL